MTSLTLEQAERIERLAAENRELRAEQQRIRAALIYRPVSGADAEVCRGCWLVGFNGVEIAHAANCWVAPLLA